MKTFASGSVGLLLMCSLASGQNSQKSQGECSPNFIGNNNTNICDSFSAEDRRKLDALLHLAKESSQQARFLEQYPLGYTIFTINAVTEAVTPVDAHHGKGSYDFDFRYARILSLTPDHIEIRLPDLIEDGKVLYAKPNIGGDLRSMQLSGAGFHIGVGCQELEGIGQVLQYNGNQITWIFGLRSFTPPKEILALRGCK